MPHPAGTRPLSDQVVVITGASSGIGLETARSAAEGGASVFLVARNGAALAEAVDGIVGSGGKAGYAVADVGKADEVKAAAAAAVDRFGRIDSWVNNAGVSIYARLVDTPLDEHERMFRTNYFGAVNGSMAALPYLKESGGTLITVASIASDIPSPIMGAYAASKHAVKAYIQSLRIELIADEVPVTVTLIKPAGIDTPIGRHAANHVDGEALIPPIVYDPKLVAQAILDACVNRRREITVGGSGRAQVLFGTHFPRLLDQIGRFMIPTLSDPSRPATPGSNLFGAMNDGHVRSGTEHGRQTSLYTVAERHRPAIGLGVAGAAGLAAILLLRRRRG